MGIFLWQFWMLVVSHALRSDLDETIWTQGENGKLYLINRSLLAWSDANRACQEKNSKLITLESNATEGVYKQIIKNDKHGLYWTGLSEDLFHRWSWESGIGKVVYSNWAPGQPYQESESPGCVLVNPVGKWQVSDCEVERMSICEKPDDGTSYTKESFPKSIHFINESEADATKVESLDQIYNHTAYQSKVQIKNASRENKITNLSANYDDTGMLHRLEKLRSYLNDSSDQNKELNSPTAIFKPDLNPTSFEVNKMFKDKFADKFASKKAYARHLIKSRVGGPRRFGIKKNSVLTASARNIIDEVTIRTTGGNGRNRSCVFPFVMHEKTYFKCIKTPEKQGKKWCAVTSNYDRDLQWGFCSFEDFLKVKEDNVYEQPLLEKAKNILNEKKPDNTLLDNTLQYPPRFQEDSNNETAKIPISQVMEKKQTEAATLADKLVSVILKKIIENPAEKSDREKNKLSFEKKPTKLKVDTKLKVAENLIKAKQNEDKPKNSLPSHKKFKKVGKAKNFVQSIKYGKNEYGNDKLKIQMVKYINTARPNYNLKNENTLVTPLLNKTSSDDYVMNVTIELTKNTKTDRKGHAPAVKKKPVVTQVLPQIAHSENPKIYSVGIISKPKHTPNEINKDETSGEFSDLVSHILHQIKDVSKSEESTEVFGQAHDLYDLINQPNYNQSVSLTHSNKDLTNKDMKTLDQIEKVISNGVKSDDSNSSLEPQQVSQAESVKLSQQAIVNEIGVKENKDTHYSKIDFEDYGILNLIEEKSNESPLTALNPDNKHNAVQLIQKNKSERHNDDSKYSHDSSVFANRIEEASHNSHGQMLIGDTEQEKETSLKEEVNSRKKLQFEDSFEEDSLVTFNHANNSSRKNQTVESTKQLSQLPIESGRNWISTLEVMLKDGRMETLKDNDLKVENHRNNEGNINLPNFNTSNKDFEYYDSTDMPLQNTIHEIKNVADRMDEEELLKNGNYLIKVIHEKEPFETTSKEPHEAISKEPHKKISKEFHETIFKSQGEEKRKQKSSSFVYSAKKPLNASVEGFNNEINKFVEKVDPTASFHKTSTGKNKHTFQPENLSPNIKSYKNATSKSEKLFIKPQKTIDMTDNKKFNSKVDLQKQLNLPKDANKIFDATKEHKNTNQAHQSTELMSEGKIKTFGGNSKGNCVFPFVYEGESYWNCINKNRSMPWCATTSNYDAIPLWRYCCFKDVCNMENNIKKQAIDKSSRKDKSLKRENQKLNIKERKFV